MNVASGSEVPFAEISSQIRASASVLLGERHGVVAHPRSAACLLQSLAEESGPTVSLVMEHLRSDQQSAVDLYRESHPEVAGGLGPALKWWETGWPAWKIYQPLVEAAWQQRASLRAGDISKADSDRLRNSASRDASAYPALVASWGEAMAEAHCGLIEAGRKVELGALQVVRDMSMAKAVESAPGRIVMLYAGRAHIRKDRSVPQHLGARKAISVALWETRDGRGPVDRAKVISDSKGRYDFVWFVGETSERPVCDRLRQGGLIK
ncbi:MAG: ChaN family lipoprotein [Proteobacteria bacterium]|nr:ChaN family lipoprotein [Pseudomonadota bacterium]